MEVKYTLPLFYITIGPMDIIHNIRIGSIPGGAGARRARGAGVRVTPLSCDRRRTAHRLSLNPGIEPLRSRQTNTTYVPVLRTGARLGRLLTFTKGANHQ